MHAVLICVSGAAVCIWIYLLLMRGFFWRVRVEHAAPASSPTRIVAVVPARNESRFIGRAVTSLLAQNRDLKVVVVDDASSDNTAEQARAAAKASGAPERLTVIPGSPLPTGWTGKLWAVHQGVERAISFGPDFLLLTDADIEHGPGSIAGLVGIAERERADLTSYMVQLRCESFAEKLLIPAFVYFFFQLFPPAWIANPDSKTAGAAGGCMLVRPDALQCAGGIAAIRSEIIDDCALAKTIKRSGGRVWLGLTASSRSLRGYGDFLSIGRMISRTAFNQLQHSTLLLVATIIGLLLTYIAPVSLPPSGDTLIMVLGGIAWALMTASYVPIIRFYRLTPLWAVTLPVAAVFYISATVSSAFLYWSGRGGQWKGRAQDVSNVSAQ